MEMTRGSAGSTATGTPSASRHARVERQSAAVEKLPKRLVPSARAAKMAKRWETDLSPGSRNRPRRRRAGAIRLGVAGATISRPSGPDEEPQPADHQARHRQPARHAGDGADGPRPGRGPDRLRRGRLALPERG